jgi:putative inorganic carbon (hco3(-)) transporter
VGVVFAAFVVLLTSLPLATAALAVAALLGGLAGLVAALRFEWFVVGLLLVRSALDVLDQEDGAGGGLDPAAAIGMLFVVIGGVWLLVQWQAGTWTRPSAATRGLWLLVGACVLSVPLADERAPAMEATLKVVAGTVMFAVLEQLLSERPARARAVLLVALVSVVVPVGIGISQLTGDELSADLNSGLSRVQGSFVHPNVFATYLVTLLLAGVAVFPVVRGWARFGVSLVVLASGVLLVLTYARAAWAAALVGVVYLGVNGRKRLLAVLVVGVVVLVTAVPSIVTRLADVSAEREYEDQPANSLAWRIGYWGELVPLASSNPATGIGLDTARFKTDDGLRPHNVFVQTYVETGIAGCAALIAVIVGFTRSLAARKRAAATDWERALALGAIAIALSWLVQAPTENLTTSTVLWWYAAAAMTFGLGQRRRPAVVERPPEPVAVA